MDLVRKCPACAEPIRVDAYKCKHCKSEVTPLSKAELKELIEAKKKESYVPYPIAFLAIGCAILFAFWIADDSISGSSKATAPTAAPEFLYVKGPAIGCKTKEDYQRSFSILVNEEWEALARIVASGRCITLRDSDKIFVEDSTLTMVRIRLSGSTEAYWTGIEVAQDS